MPAIESKLRAWWWSRQGLDGSLAGAQPAASKKAEPATQVLGYLRYLEGSADPVLVLLNFSEEPAPVHVAMLVEFAALTGRLSDLLNEEEVAFRGTNAIQMNPMSARILALKKE